MNERERAERMKNKLTAATASPDRIHSEAPSVMDTYIPNASSFFCLFWGDEKETLIPASVKRDATISLLYGLYV